MYHEFPWRLLLQDTGDGLQRLLDGIIRADQHRRDIRERQLQGDLPYDSQLLFEDGVWPDAPVESEAIISWRGLEWQDAPPG